MSHPRLQLLAAVALVAAAAPGWASERSTATTIAVFGDAPYGSSPTDTRQFDATPAFIDLVNSDPKVQLVIHVGDIHSGSQYCTEAYDRAVFDLWTRFKDPLIYTPGDNEWSDCHKKKEGGGAYNPTTGKIDFVLDAQGQPVDYAAGDPVANLDLVRSIFFSHPGQSLGTRKKSVLSQALLSFPGDPDGKYVENVMWIDGKVLYVTLNVPGGSNADYDVWYGAPRMSPAQVQEIAERSRATLNWLGAAFRLARAAGAQAMVIAAQADMWDPEKGAAHQDKYEPFIAAIASHTLQFAKPVLMFTGDSHVYETRNPFDPTDSLFSMHPFYEVPNFRRIVVQGSPPDPVTNALQPLEYLRLTVDVGRTLTAGSSTFGPFSWERCTAAGCVVP